MMSVYEAIGMNWTAIMEGQYPRCSDFNSSWSIGLTFGSGPDLVEMRLTGDQFISFGYGFRDTACALTF